MSECLPVFLELPPIFVLCTTGARSVHVGAFAQSIETFCPFRSFGVSDTRDESRDESRDDSILVRSKPWTLRISRT